MQLNEAVSRRLTELLDEREMTQYKLFKRTGVSKSTISNIIACNHQSMNLRVLHEICQGLDINIVDFFTSPLFDNENLDP